MSGLKKDAAEIKTHLRHLRQAGWLGPARKWWPDYVYHFTDITNAVSILRCGKLLCRSQAKIATDIASAQVIGQTDDAWKNQVRLYFRPRTPTQFHNEGFRPVANLGGLHAHCPMPVFFLFDAETILTQEHTQFSDGNLASSSPCVGSDAGFLTSIPFEKVFHDSWLNEHEKRNIIYHRHAEILVPNELELNSLKWLVCRSEAEVRTLNHLLPSKTWDKYSKKIKVSRPLFFRRWTFVEKAELDQRLIKIWFNPSTLTPQPFKARLDILDTVNGLSLYWENASFTANNQLLIRSHQLGDQVPYEVKFTLDGSLAYSDEYFPEQIPF
jgi:hypothetical protein